MLLKPQKWERQFQWRLTSCSVLQGLSDCSMLNFWYFLYKSFTLTDVSYVNNTFNNKQQNLYGKYFNFEILFGCRFYQEGLLISVYFQCWKKLFYLFFFNFIMYIQFCWLLINDISFSFTSVKMMSALHNHNIFLVHLIDMERNVHKRTITNF